MRYWKHTDKNGKTTTVESYSHDLNVKEATEITEIEFQEYIDSLPEPKPPQNLAVEIDALKARVEALETVKVT